MSVLRGSLIMEQLCSSHIFPLPVTPLKAASLDVHGACAVLLGWLFGNTSHIQVDSIKWIWSGGTVLFSHGETEHSAQYLSACPWVFSGVPSQDCGYQPDRSLPMTCQQWQPYHQLLIRISHNRALLLWGPAQFCVETEGVALGKCRLRISSWYCYQYSTDLFCGTDRFVH